MTAARFALALLASALVASASASAVAQMTAQMTAQVKVRTQAIKRAPPAPELAHAMPGTCETPDPNDPSGTSPQPMPEAVARMRYRILTTAQSGDPGKLVALMREGDVMPVFTRTQKLDPALVWKEAYPDSDGVEALSILATILESACARFAAGTPQETYVWPLVALLPPKALTPPQKVELFRIITGSDYQGMLEGGHYSFYRVGIAPDGAWRYFVPGR